MTVIQWTKSNVLQGVKGFPIYHHISMKITTISLRPPTNSGAQISASFTGFRICKKYLHIFEGLGSHTPVSLKKANKKMEVFCSSPLWNMNFGRSKIDFIWSVWSFWDMIWKDVSFLSVDKQFRLQLWASFHAKFGRKDKSFIQVKKCKKKWMHPLYPLSNK